MRTHFCYPVRSRVGLSVALSMVLLLLVLLHIQSLLPKPSLGFKVQLTEREQSSLLQTMDVFTSALTNASIVFFLISGTLLGSWRHHGRIPWDDDLDFALLFQDSKRIVQVLGGLQPRYVLNTDHPKRWKFFDALNTDPIPDKTWKFPFVDLNFFHVNETYVWDNDVENYPYSRFLRSEVFPLTLRPFHGRQLPAPRDTRAVLEQDYGGMDECVTIHFYHRDETGGHLVERTPCRTLMARFPFVHRQTMTSGGCNETLVLNKTVIAWHAFPDQSC